MQREEVVCQLHWLYFSQETTVAGAPMRYPTVDVGSPEFRDWRLLQYGGRNPVERWACPEGVLRETGCICHLPPMLAGVYEMRIACPVHDYEQIQDLSEIDGVVPQAEEETSSAAAL